MSIVKGPDWKFWSASLFRVLRQVESEGLTWILLCDVDIGTDASWDAALHLDAWKEDGCQRLIHVHNCIFLVADGL